MLVKPVATSNQSDLWAEFEHQAEFPPGGDKVIAASYKAVCVLAGKNPAFRSKIEQIALQRGLTSKHLVNLFFRGVQYIWLFEENNNDYPDRLVKPEEWEEELSRIMASKSGEVLMEILGSRDTGTTVYQRYIGPKAILSALWPDRKLVVADLGCGGNHGLPGLMTGEKFKPVIDHNAEKLITEWIERPISFKLGLGVDKHDPYDLEVINWRIACSFYPSELPEMTNFLDFEKRVRSLGEKIFLKGDIATLSLDLPVRNKCDAVIASTVLYQLQEEERFKVITSAKALLKKTGILIAQDFARKADGGQTLEFDGSWFGEGYGYRTFIQAEFTEGKFWEIFAWKNGRCKEVREGEDFGKFLNIVDKKNRMEVRMNAN